MFLAPSHFSHVTIWDAAGTHYIGGGCVFDAPTYTSSSTLFVAGDGRSYNRKRGEELAFRLHDVSQILTLERWAQTETPVRALFTGDAPRSLFWLEPSTLILDETVPPFGDFYGPGLRLRSDLYAPNVLHRVNWLAGRHGWREDPALPGKADGWSGWGALEASASWVTVGGVSGLSLGAEEPDGAIYRATDYAAPVGLPLTFSASLSLYVPGGAAPATHAEAQVVLGYETGPGGWILGTSQVVAIPATGATVTASVTLEPPPGTLRISTFIQNILGPTGSRVLFSYPRLRSDGSSEIANF